METTISIPEAVVPAARDALQDDAGRLRGWTRGWLDSSPVYTKDVESDTEIDPDGTFTGTVNGRILRLSFRRAHISRIVQQVLDAAAITYEVLESVQGDILTDEDGVDAHLADAGQRRPGRKYAAYGTFAADGTKPSQTVNTSGTRVNQWNDVIDLRGMTKFPATGQVSGPAGDYEIRLGVEYDAALSPGVVWTVQATVGNAGVGPTKTSDNGSVRGRVRLTGLLAGDKIGVGIAPDTDGSEFKVLLGKVRVARI